MMPTVTKNLIIINVLFYLGTIVAQSYGIDLANYLGLHFFMAEDFNPAQLITYMFMHGGFTHLFFNMFAVWMFGRISLLKILMTNECIFRNVFYSTIFFVVSVQELSRRSYNSLNTRLSYRDIPWSRLLAGQYR